MTFGSARTAVFHNRLRQFRPHVEAVTRSLALYSAAIALSTDDSMAEAIRLARFHGTTGTQLYEVMLQSYLFLGFPRMLRAAEVLQASEPVEVDPAKSKKPTPEETSEWYDRGVELCQTVYGDTFPRLRERVVGLAPEVFRWMILEGYGKVLSRPGLDSVARELCIVSCLMMDNKPSQLFSHMRGARNVGASAELLVQVVDDLGEAAGAGYDEARVILSQLEVA